MHIGVIDPICPQPYEFDTSAETGLGGTEATALRVFGQLASSFEITFFQNNRTEQSFNSGIHSRPLSELKDHAPLDRLITIGSWEFSLQARQLFPNVPIVLWLHNYANRHNRSMGNALREANIKLVCVSKTHMNATKRLLETRSSCLPRLSYIYNAIDDALLPNNTPRCKNRLLFASSPNKGLLQVLEKFDAISPMLPELQLEVANPGYLQFEPNELPPNVIFLGSLSQPKLIEKMRTSLCLFCPQTTFAETFGLVIAEANAVGTPVICQASFGANDEIVSSVNQAIDTANLETLVERIQQLQKSKCMTSARPEFRLENVARHWDALLLDG
ncbi:MAG: glycosyltransferase family 4 protein [Rhizobiaceae bacterium]